MDVVDAGVDDVLGDRRRVAVGVVDFVVGAALQLSCDAVILVVDGRGRHLALFEAVRVGVERELLGLEPPEKVRTTKNAASAATTMIKTTLRRLVTATPGGDVVTPG